MKDEKRRHIFSNYLELWRSVSCGKHKVSDRKVQGIHKRGEMTATDFAKEVRG